MSSTSGSFDFSNYNPNDPWNFPPGRLIDFVDTITEIFRKSRNEYARQHPYPDQRYVVFHELHSAAYSLKVYAILLRDHTSKLEWWRSLPDFTADYDKRLVQSLNMGLREFLKYGFYHVFAQQVEDTLLQVYRHVDQAWDARDPGYWDMCKILFEMTNTQVFSGLPELIWASRNSLQNNGKYCPPSGKDLKVLFKGETYSFVNEEEVVLEDWGFKDSWDFISFQANEIDFMLNAIFQSKEVKSIPYIRTRYLD